MKSTFRTPLAREDLKDLIGDPRRDHYESQLKMGPHGSLLVQEKKGRSFEGESGKARREKSTLTLVVIL